MTPRTATGWSPSLTTPPTRRGERVVWLLTLLALTLERLYRLRYLHRGRHRVRCTSVHEEQKGKQRRTKNRAIRKRSKG